MKMVTLALGALVLLAVADTHRFTCEQECREKYCHAISKRRFVCQNECLMRCHLQRSEQQWGELVNVRYWPKADMRCCTA